MNTLPELIRATRGKFFSITFTKKDGTVRKINGKDKYFRLIKGGGSPAIDALHAKGYASFVNRNKDSWASAHDDAVIEFRCGSTVKTLS